MQFLDWGLWMTLAGMGSVFLLLIALMGLLYGIGVIDKAGKRPAVEAAPEPAALAASQPAAPQGDALGTGADAATPAPAVVLPGGLTPDQMTALTIALARHIRVRRLQASPEARLHQPGSQLFASRWVSIGRGYQQQPWNRRS